jgi:hypothetical protein
MPGVVGLLALGVGCWGGVVGEIHERWVCLYE